MTMARDRRRVEAHRLAAEGVGVREIARRLGVNPSTISRDLREPPPEIEPVANLQREDGCPVAGATEGNTRALTHGGHAAELIEARARELAPRVLEANPHLEPERDGPGVRRYAIALARCERVYTWLTEQDDPVFADGDGKVHGVYERLERCERQADTAEDRLAISPLTRTKLGIDQARGLSMVAEMQGRRRR